MKMLIFLFLSLFLLIGCRKDLERVSSLKDVYRKLKGEWVLDSLYSYGSWNFPTQQRYGHESETYFSGTVTKEFYENTYCGPTNSCITRDTSWFTIEIKLDFYRFNEMNKTIHYKYYSSIAANNGTSIPEVIDLKKTEDWSRIDRDTSIYFLNLRGENYTIETLTENILELKSENYYSGLAGSTSYIYYLRFRKQ